MTPSELVDKKATCPLYYKHCLEPRKTQRRMHSGRVRSGNCSVEGVGASGPRSRSSRSDGRRAEMVSGGRCPQFYLAGPQICAGLGDAPPSSWMSRPSVDCTELVSRSPSRMRRLSSRTRSETGLQGKRTGTLRLSRIPSRMRRLSSGTRSET